MLLQRPEMPTILPMRKLPESGVTSERGKEYFNSSSRWSLRNVGVRNRDVRRNTVSALRTGGCVGGCVSVWDVGIVREEGWDGLVGEEGRE
jgi:hypothetical protein